ncbi:hypothetical protein FJQ54_01875 [Sandaracinobacter neustonicus]|uniref:DUF6265 domain-containing protein n=1 Tax=Sandaracinobacter neustonicus TaxID=1715348 RepID=A0A501XST4_9SPHN|nr:DUF6265 family protein [Sandaracinobacter neustonicus]TPE63636.1 hypothetical protein FJQ54_01875 [Sandaracinobacter neustonicus]
MTHPAPAQTVEGLGWLAGDWAELRGELLTEESWMPPRGGMLIGMNRAGTAERVAMFEFMRIAAGEGGRLALHVQPRGAPASAFPATAFTQNSITFENAAHDYPQRIRYWREGEVLMAEISLADGSKPFRWRFERKR